MKLRLKVIKGQNKQLKHLRWFDSTAAEEILW